MTHRKLAAECAGIAARALQKIGRPKQAAEYRLAAESGFRQLGAVSLLELLEREWGV